MKEFVMRGQTASSTYHTMNFSGHKGDYGFRLVEFSIYPSTNIGGVHYELAASITAAKLDGSGTPADPYVSPADPSNADFNQEGLIASALLVSQSGIEFYGGTGIVNDTFLITQDLTLAVIDTVAGAPMAVNWQCKFLPVKLSSAEAALTNYRQFSIFDD